MSAAIIDQRCCVNSTSKSCRCIYQTTNTKLYMHIYFNELLLACSCELPRNYSEQFLLPVSIHCIENIATLYSTLRLAASSETHPDSQQQYMVQIIIGHCNQQTATNLLAAQQQPLRNLVSCMVMSVHHNTRKDNAIYIQWGITKANHTHLR